NKLLSIVLELAEFNNLEPEFRDWLNNSNRFCNSLVDRIVPGKPSDERLKEFYNKMNYEDSLMIVSEPYSLWAIEGDDFVKQKLSFSASDSTVIIEEDIQKYRELKLRLLNGTHTLSCAVSLLMNLEMVHESMKDELVKNFVDKLMKEEIGRSIPAEVEEKDIIFFTNQVIDRFRNPYINHKWMSISFQYTSKMVLRNIPLLQEWYRRYHSVPRLITMGFAAYLYFMRPFKKGDLYYGNFNGKEYLIEDVFAEFFAKKWQGNFDPSALKEVIKLILGEVSIWGTNLNELPGFYEAVLRDVNIIKSEGMRSALQTVLNHQVV
ncbi:MAG: mannitol dehydrogenase family protein, partial [Flavitalea sp.]